MVSQICSVKRSGEYSVSRQTYNIYETEDENWVWLIGKLAMSVNVIINDSSYQSSSLSEGTQASTLRYGGNNMKKQFMRKTDMEIDQLINAIVRYYKMCYQKAIYSFW